MASALYNSFKKKIMDGSIDLDTDTIKVALTTSTYSPSIDNHTWFSDITNEVTGVSYSAGGVALANKSVTIDNTNDWAYWDADDTSWTTATITARYAIIYKSTGVAATSPLIGYIDFATDKLADGGTFLITWSATGIIKLT